MDQTRVGIFGDGQLAAMLCQAATELDISSLVLAAKRHSPASHFADECVLLRPGRRAIYSRFSDACNVLSFENEFWDFDDAIRHGCDPKKCSPNLDAVFLLRNKLSQKKLLRELKIPTPSFLAIDSSATAMEWTRRLTKDFSDTCVIKKAIGGYDGRGNLVFDFGLPLDEAEDFIEDSIKHASGCYAESFVDFKRELAQVSVRSKDGSIHHFPLVESVQENGICRFVKSSIKEKVLVEQAQKTLEVLLERLDYVGVLAVEFFHTKKGKLLVNELAPRVHNSGHVTLDSVNVSQFHAHLLAVTGRPIPEIKEEAPAAVMFNILGPRIDDIFHIDWPRWQKDPLPSGAQLYWYEKQQLKPGRKMGHINVPLEDPKMAGKLFEELAVWERNLWSKNLKTLLP